MLIDFDESIMIVAFLVWIIVISLLKIKYKKSYTYLMFFTIFFIYLCNVLKYTQFPIILDEEIKKEMGQNVWRDANFIPFNQSLLAIETSLLNILLTIPFGFGISFITKVNLKRVAILGLLLGVLLESLQLIVALVVGFTFRYVDINDIIFNFTGVLLGYGLFKIFIKLFRWFMHKKKIGFNSFLRFIYDLET